MADDSLAELQRRCVYCGDKKPLSEFWKTHKDRKNGVYAACKECAAENQRRRLIGTPKTCSRCGQAKDYSEFLHKKSSRGTKSMCRACILEHKRLQESERRTRLMEGRALCACGCGKHVKYPGDTFLRRHRINTGRAPRPTKQTNEFKGTHKLCPKCGETKAIEDFDRVKTIYCTGEPGFKYLSLCKPCSRAAWRSYNQNLSPEKKRANKNTTLLRAYGISIEQYEAMEAEQGGLCAICFRPDRKLFIDHCHTRKVVRGLLCTQCNTAIGMCGEDQEIATRFLRYVRERCITPPAQDPSPS